MYYIWILFVCRDKYCVCSCYRGRICCMRPIWRGHKWRSVFHTMFGSPTAFVAAEELSRFRSCRSQSLSERSTTIRMRSKKVPGGLCSVNRRWKENEGARRTLTRALLSTHQSMLTIPHRPLCLCMCSVHESASAHIKM